VWERRYPFTEVEQWLRTNAEQHRHLHVRALSGGRRAPVKAVKVAIDEQQPRIAMCTRERGGDTDEQRAAITTCRFPASRTPRASTIPAARSAAGMNWQPTNRPEQSDGTPSTMSNGLELVMTPVCSPNGGVASD
jgi:hypothetical protein